ncbi:MAG: carboxylating nicotinate-nucleotide diphosphorylase [Candidatus Methanoplasma sp.]|jgi:nicotinate-nucleotide pyrophosphorylase (carboxylating)|nr:carboxylating nicotinate-nucleotide diphosphorylase [Candidatus Methanoplasma sp.]
MDLRPYLDEDLGAGDVTSAALVPDTDGYGVITCEEDAVAAGIEEACGVFALMGVRAEPLARDGDRVARGSAVIGLSGPLRGMLACERTALNFLMRMSGIATMASDMNAIIKAAGGTAVVAGTRKTTPGFRRFEKKAIALGGGWPHRDGLYDMAMAKDNHIAACGGVAAALSALGGIPKGIKVEIEVSTVRDGIMAAKRGVDVIMADHMGPRETRTLRDLARAIDGRVRIEASGNITPENIAEYAACADIISMGALTHSPRAVHYSMDVTDGPVAPGREAAPVEAAPGGAAPPQEARRAPSVHGRDWRETAPGGAETGL